MKIFSFFMFVSLLLKGCVDSIHYNSITNKVSSIHKNHSSISPMNGNQSVIFTEYDNKIYSIYSVDSNNVNIKVVDVNISFEISLILSDSVKIRYEDIVAIAVTNDYILLLSNIPIIDPTTKRYPSYLFYFENSKDFNFVKQIRCENESVQGMYVSDSLVFLTRSYFYHPLDEEITSLVETREVENMQLVNRRVLDIKGIEFSHITPYRNIDVLKSKGNVIYSDFSKPIIRLLDKNLKIIDTISYLPKHWINNPEEKLNEISDSCKDINPIDRIKYLSELMQSGLSKISNIGFINDSMFIVSYFSGGEIDYSNHISHFDIFKIINNKIVIYKQGLTDIKTEKYIPILLSEHLPIFKDNKAYFYSYYDYASLNSFSKLTDWIGYSLSLLTGSKIDMNLIILEYYDI